MPPTSGRSTSVGSRSLGAPPACRRGRRIGPTAAPFVQVALALGLIVLGGAKLFVGAVGDIGKAAGAPAPRVLAAGRAARDRAPREVQQRAVGAAAQGHPGDGEHDRGDGVPVVVPGDGRAAVHTVGAAHEALVAALVALLAGSVLYLTLRIRGRAVRAAVADPGRVLRRLRRVRADEALNRATGACAGVASAARPST